LDDDLFDFVAHRKWNGERIKLLQTLMNYKAADKPLGMYLLHNYRDRFGCASPEVKGEWYYFDGRLWRRKAFETIFNLVEDDITKYHAIPFINDHAVIVKKEKDKLDAIEDKKSAAYTTHKEIHSAIKKLHARYQLAVDSIITKARTDNAIYVFGSKFKDPPNKLDQNWQLLGFENGVYDFQSGIFRCARKRDMVSLSVGVCYPDLSSMTPQQRADFDRYTEEFQQFFREIFVRNELREKIYDYWTSMLIGGNEDNIFVINIGFGLNRKSTYTTLLQKVFGGYFILNPLLETMRLAPVQARCWVRTMK
jgi:phage/plasmid-associated DNA primase